MCSEQGKLQFLLLKPGDIFSVTSTLLKFLYYDYFFVPHLLISLAFDPLMSKCFAVSEFPGVERITSQQGS